MTFQFLRNTIDNNLMLSLNSLGRGSLNCVYTIAFSTKKRKWPCQMHILVKLIMQKAAKLWNFWSSLELKLDKKKWIETIEILRHLNIITIVYMTYWIITPNNRTAKFRLFSYDVIFPRKSKKIDGINPSSVILQFHTGINICT